MSWSHDQVLTLIELYREKDCLYKVKSAQYKNKHMRVSAYESILNELKTIRPGTSIQEIKAKVNGLGTNFLTEYRKHMKSMKSGSGQDSIYTPSLWYYDNMYFILEHVTSRNTIDSIDETLNRNIVITDEDDVTEEQREQTEVIEYVTDEESSQFYTTIDENGSENITIEIENDNSTKANNTPQSISHLSRTSSKKRKRSEDEPLLRAASNAMNNIVTALEGKKQSMTKEKEADDIQIFGDFVVSRLRRIKSEDVRNEVEEKITNLLFQAYRNDKI